MTKQKTEYTESDQCEHCGEYDMEYNSLVGDYRCQFCGNWSKEENN